MCVAAGFYLPLRIFSCLTALAFLSLLLLDDEKEERKGRNERGKEKRGEVAMVSRLATREKKINARNRRDRRPEIEEKI